MDYPTKCYNDVLIKIAKIEKDVETLQSKITELNFSINDMKANHLEHIYSRLNKIEIKMAWYAGAITVISIIFQFIVKFSFR